MTSKMSVDNYFKYLNELKTYIIVSVDPHEFYVSISLELIDAR